MKNILPRKRRFKNTPLKQLVSITVDRFKQATAEEKQAILNFFDWLIENTANPELKSFHIQVKSKFAEVE